MNIIFNHILLVAFRLCLYIASIKAYPEGYRPDFNHKFPIFYSLESILDVFEKEKENYREEVDLLMDVYRNQCLFAPEPEPIQGKRKPFIVLEGNYRHIRESIGKHLEARMGGKFLLVPPKCLANYTTLFPKKSTLRTAFFGLCAYVSAFNARHLMSLNQSIFLNGYWTDQASFVISKRYLRHTDLPPRGDEIYNFPRDLTVPDLVFYINYPYDRDNVPYTTPTPYYKPKKILIYQRFETPPIIEIDIRQGFHSAVDQIQEQIRLHLGEKLDTSYSSPAYTPNIT